MWRSTGGEGERRTDGPRVATCVRVAHGGERESKSVSFALEDRLAPRTHLYGNVQDARGECRYNKASGAWHRELRSF